MPGQSAFNQYSHPPISIDRDIGEEYRIIKAVYEALLAGTIADFLAAIANDRQVVIDAINSTFFAKIDVDCSGNQTVVLTETQYTKGLINLTGTLSADIKVVFPNSGRWAVFNTSFGGHKITVATAAGDGVDVGNGKGRPVFADGVNMLDDAFDFANQTLPPGATASNPDLADDSNKIATTHWVKSLDYITMAALQGAASEQFVEDYVGSHQPDLSGFLTAASIAGYATQAYVATYMAAHMPAGVDLTPYAMTAWVTGNFDPINSAANALIAAKAYTDGKLSGAQSKSATLQQISGSGGVTLNPSVSFTPTSDGTLFAIGARNNASGGSNTSGQLFINGNPGPEDSTTTSMSHSWAARVAAGTACSAQYTTSSSVQFSATVTLIFIPDA